MKVPAVNFSNMTSSRYRPILRNEPCQNNNTNQSEITTADIPYICPIIFRGKDNSGGQAKLRKLFQYGLPCMYSGAIMIDPKLFTKWLTSGLADKNANAVLQTLEPYKDSFEGKEAHILHIISERSKIHPQKTIKELITDISPVYKRRLRKEQTPIFHELKEASKDMDDEYKYRFQELMEVTDNKLNERPIIIPFSSYEFKYKLLKINEYIQQGDDIKAKKVMNKLIKESNRFASRTNEKTIDFQQRIINFMEIILKKSVLKDNPQLKNLIETSKSRLMQKEIIAPFSRKQFIYDLRNIIDEMPDKNLRNKMLKIAEKLPTSNENFSAYIVKLAALPSDKILHNIVRPYTASIEHLKPKSEGGEVNNIANLGVARTTINSDRKSRDFRLWLHEHPETRQNCQKYIDRIIELYHDGTLKKNGIDPKYIIDFKNTIYTLSGKELELDISGYTKSIIAAN